MIELTNLKNITTLLKKHNLWAKKRFGQNFLISTNPLNAIVKAANISKKDQIIEIGPGLGVLTQELAQRAAKVTSLELDKTLLPVLEETLGEFKNLEIINIDALKFEPKIKNYKIVANIPYNITSPLLNHFLQAKNKPTSMTLLTQKEVSQKICDPKKESILSLQVKLFATPKIIQTVPSSAFYPEPKVDSAIIHIELHKKSDSEYIETKEALEILKIAKIAFSQKRKKLSNTLKRSLKLSNEEIEQILNKSKIPLKARPEDLSIKDWQEITKTVSINYR